MFQISKVVFVIYCMFLMLYTGIHFTAIPFILIIVFVTIILLIIALIQLIISIIKREEIREKTLIVVLLLIPLIGLFVIREQELTKKKTLSAYSDGVISGADIAFYEDNRMEYCSMGLLGEKCYSGKFELIKDTFFVTYSNGLPNITSTKMIKVKNKFLFIGEKGEIEYEFYLDREVLRYD